MGNTFLVIISLMLNIILYCGIFYEYRKVRKSENVLYYNCVMAAGIIVLLIYYAYSIYSRRMVYTWDYANYYRIQLRLNAWFENDIYTTVRSVAGSLLLDDYNCFISLFCALPFTIFQINSVNSFIIAYFFICIIPVIIAYSVLVRAIIDTLDIRHAKSFYVSAMIIMITMPLINYSALLGQPDIFGLVFVFMLIAKALTYRFEKRDIKSYIYIFACTIALMLTRRWYMYWVVGFFVMYLCMCMVRCAAPVRKGVIKNITAFVIASAVVGGTGLFPMLRRILLYNYADRYAFYNLGGIAYEITNQIRYIGPAFAVLVILGAVAGIICKRTRYYAVSGVGIWIICMLMFTRVQNTAEHQSLIYVPEYILLVLIALCAAECLVSRSAAYRCMALAAALIAAGNAAAAGSALSGGIFTSLDIRPVVREDMASIGEVYQYICDITADDSIYIIPHGKLYNPDVFRNYEAPGSMEDKIAYGSCVLGTHSFPTEFFNAGYIMTCSPVDDLDMADNTIVKNLDTALAQLVGQGKFKLIKTFAFSNGYTFYIYERTQKPDVPEIEYLKELFRYQSQKYPEMFEEVLQNEENLIRK